MSILIKGMEMPKDCGRCRFAIDGWCYAYGKPNINALANDGRTNFCPLVHVPPHGRLIDADKITFVESENGCQDDYAFRYDINEMPTIIPAEEGE